jgi:hypothetical protein
VQPFPDRSDKWQVSTRGGNDAHWNARGDEIFYLSPDQQMMAVPVKTVPTFDPGTPVGLFAANVLFPGGQRAHYDVTGDGHTFVVYRPTSTRSLPTTTVVVNWMGDLAKR